MFADKLIEKIQKVNNISVVGLDPKIEYLPEEIKKKYFKEIDAIEEYNIRIIEAISGEVGIIKPQLAFYEAYGYEGIKCYEETVKYAKKKGLIVIADAKRGDIGTTAEAYARAFFTGSAQVDALTINPYMGFDTVEPFLNYVKKDKGLFILLKTSNKCSGDLQDLVAEDGKKIYIKTADKINEWGENYIGSNKYSSIMAVVGATYPHELKEIREKYPHIMFLVPGYGAQGGTSEDIGYALDDNGLGAVVNSSRGIITAHQKAFEGQSFEDAILSAVISMKNDLNSIKFKK